MPHVTANGISLYYERHGSSEHPKVLFISGLGSQIVYWRRDMYQPIIDAGFEVILFENRDSGLSEHFDGARVSVMRVLEVLAEGGKPDVPYLLMDMADDTAGLLTALDIDAAHVVGVSMGGYIAQVMAIRHPQRVLSLTSIMSTTGNPEVGGATPEMTEALFTAPPTEREAAIQSTVDYARLAWGDYFDETRAREHAIRNLDRVVYPQGTGRQLAAILASGDRTRDLKTITAPSLVIHGEKDPLIDISGGRATAEAIPDAEFWMMEGAGHDLPPELYDELISRLIAHFRRSVPPVGGTEGGLGRAIGPPAGGTGGRSGSPKGAASEASS